MTIAAAERALLISEIVALVNGYGLTSAEVRRAAEIAALDTQHRTGRLPHRLTCRVLVSVREAVAAIAKEKAQ